MGQRQRQFLTQGLDLFTLRLVDVGSNFIVLTEGPATAAAANAHLNIRHLVPVRPLLVSRIGAVASTGPGRGLLRIA